MLDIRKIRMLAELQRLGTMAAVAGALHLAPSGVSMQLAALEKEVGLPLTRRRGRRVELTAAGSVLARHGHDILDRISLAEHELASLRTGSIGRYDLIAFPSAARTFVADALRHLVTPAGTGLDLRVETAEPEDALDALIAGRADLAVIHSYSNVPRDLPTGISVARLAVERVRLAVPRGTLASSRLADHAERPWIAPTAPLTCAAMVDRACGLAGFRPRVVARSTDFAVQLSWVAAGLGVALVPDLAIGGLPDGVELVSLREPVERRLSLAARLPDWPDPGIRVIADVLVDATRHSVQAVADR